MKGFERSNPLFSLCGLNCGLCPMFVGRYCGGCGHGSQACAIARCSRERGNVEYCFACAEYPCERYANETQYDSFITYRRQKADLERARQIGAQAYTLELTEKMRALETLLAGYNDGRRKSFFCVAVNLLEIEEIREAMQQIKAIPEDLPVKQRSAMAVEALKAMAARRSLELKLRKKPTK